MEDFNLDIVARKSVKGVFALASRTFLVSILSAIANLILTIFLDPASFGVFFVVSSIIVFLTYFQDIGLAGSLIQKKGQLTVEELRTTFTIQQLLVLILVIPGFLFSSFIFNFYHLNHAGSMLFYALLLSFSLSSIKTVPTVLLERSLNFDKLAFSQIVENVVYNISLIIFAIMGFGITSFTIAVLTRSIVGLIMIYVIQPWSIGLAFKINIFKRLVSFGLPLQANSILALLKDDLLNIYIGKVLPFSEVGYIAFSQKLAFLPLRFVMDHVIKVTFPSFSRLQHDRDALKVLVEKSLFVISFLIFPIVVILSVFSSDAIRLIPIPHYQEKWNPSYLWLLIIFFSLNTLFASVTVPLTNFLNAVGKVKKTLYIMIFLTIFSWILTPILIKLFGYNGVALASFIVAASAIVVVFIVKKYVKFSFFKPIRACAIGAIVMLVIALVTRGIAISFPLLILEIIVSSLIYLIVVYFLNREELIRTIRFLTKSVIERR